MSKLDTAEKSPVARSYGEVLRDYEWRLTSVVFAILLTIALIILGVFTIFDAVRVRQEYEKLRSLLCDAHQRLLAADENIGTTTLAYVQAQGDHYLTQRANYVAEFDALVESLVKLGNEKLCRLAEEVSSASLVVSRYEVAAIQLASEGKTTSAIEILQTSAYMLERSHLRSLLSLLSDENAPHLHSLRIRLSSAYGTALLSWFGVLLISSMTWVGLVLRLKRWRRALTELLEDRTKMAEALRESEERFSLALTGANDGIWDWDLRQNRIFYSPRWKWLLGYEDHEVGPTPAEWLTRIHSEDREAFQQAIRDHLEGRSRLLDVEIRMVTRRGEWRWMHIRGVAIVDDRRQPIRMAGSMTDITRRKVAEEQLRHGAYHDPLTQLPNRAHFLELLQRAVARVRRHPEQQFAILFLDLDNFKHVNDHYGHTTGDDCLAQMAARLAASVRPSDVVARIGGDEFIVLVEDVESPQHVYDLAHRLEEVVRQPLRIGDVEVSVGVSIGIAFSNEPFAEPMDLIALADEKMYRIKAARKSNQPPRAS
ncbi:MAG: diguanylate cyclase domain-containing protein [Candidatus Sumerlaeaceae bacterium]